jgi:hypothetical protein
MVPLKKSFALFATTAYIATVVILIQAIAAQARIESHFDARQVASSPLDLDDPCNRSTVVEIKFCGTVIGIAGTREQRMSSRAAGFDTHAAGAGARDALVPRMFAEGARQ